MSDPERLVIFALTLSGSSLTVLNAILLTGYTRDAVVPRVVNNVVVKFPTGCPKACALIGDLNDTLRDRCIVVKMRRATPHGDLDASYDMAEEFGHTLRARAIESVSAAMDEIRTAILDSTESPFRYREKQIWRPLFALCAVFCPSRASQFVRVAADLSAEKKTGRHYRAQLLRDFEKQADQEMWGRWLLEDMIRVIKMQGRKAMETAEIIAALFALNEAPWRKFGGPDDLDGNGLNADNMARLLKPFGVGPRRFWFGPKKAVIKSMAILWLSLRRHYGGTRHPVTRKENGDAPYHLRAPHAETGRHWGCQSGRRTEDEFWRQALCLARAHASPI